jgi:hypothetical protein
MNNSISHFNDFRKNDEENRFNWQELIDYTSGQLSQPIKETITKFSGTKITSFFSELFNKMIKVILCNNKLFSMLMFSC